jgi:pyruvate dehydrogenase E2 component (dihydrolipoamide acetyltransferase)
MPKTIVMPALSAGMEEGTIVRWLKAEGDTIARGEIIAEVETDKATMEYESEFDGVLAKIIASDGSTVPVNGAIALLAVDGEAAEAPIPCAASAPEAPARAADPPAHLSVVTAASRHRPASSPLARRIANLRGISLGGLTGSGPSGRIVRIDVETATAQASKALQGDAPALPAPVVSEPALERAIPQLATAAKPDAPYVEVPHSGMRKAIARRLTEAKSTIPHFYLAVECEIDALLELRTTLNDQAHGAYQLSVNDFVVKAAALALRKVPEANSTWTDDAVRLFNDVDISVAVSTDSGLMTPIVWRADQKGLATISTDIRKLAGRARAGKLQPADYQGGGFTISNLGMFGVRSFQAIINPPQSCILAVGAAERRPVVRGDACVPATVMSCTLSVDHRSVDGAVGARFLGELKTLLQNPLLLML